MGRWVLLLLGLSLLGGCQSVGGTPRGQTACEMFAPTAMRLHPIFTRVRDWTGDGKPDGVEALLEFEDRFSDPTKAMGRVVFELYSYVPGSPDPRGQRVVNPWIGSLMTLQQQREHWNRTSRTYSFQLAYPQINPKQSYVLTAIFDRAGGGRFFDRLILQGTGGQKRESRPHAGGVKVK